MTRRRIVRPDGLAVRSSSPRRRRTPPRGFTLGELLLTAAVLLTILGIGIAIYRDYVSEAKNAVAIADITLLGNEIVLYQRQRGALPDTLADLGRGSMRDPWGSPYEYLNLASAAPGLARKDRFLVPLNSDYDLYSRGPDGNTAAPLTAQQSRDDIVRANDGAFVGLASEF